MPRSKTKTLGQRLADIPDDEIINIGPSGGTNFIWCGTKAGFLRHEKELSKKYREDLKVSISNAKFEYNAACKTLEALDKVNGAIKPAQNSLKEITIKSQDGEAKMTLGQFYKIYKSAKDACAKERDAKKGLAERNEKRLKEWKAFNERKIDRVYMTPCKEIQTFIYIGKESGRYWGYEECKEDYKDA